jgi:hypothetical protein
MGHRIVWDVMEKKNLLPLPEIESRFLCRPARILLTIPRQLRWTGLVARTLEIRYACSIFVIKPGKPVGRSRDDTDMDVRKWDMRLWI